ncbi:MAG TPA: hypothetical protein VN844_07020 [Pyrinomonadaceae bacterium]|nr:hypothetical protein [Pyrinomonadaceae bacterium]
MKINLHIERLVLDGLPIARYQSSLVQAAVERELARLFAAEETHSRLSFTSGATPRLAGPTIHGLTDNPIRTGEQIAQAVHGSFTR